MNDCERLFEEWWRENGLHDATVEEKQHYRDCWNKAWAYSIGGVVT